MTGTDNIMDMRVSELRALAKERGLRWYTGLNKKDLVNFIEASKHQSVGNEEWKDYSKLKAIEMRKVARENGLRGWTNLNKAKLGKFLNDSLNTPRSQPTESKSESAKIMLRHGFTVDEVFRELGLETLRLDISKSDMVSETEMGCGILCSNNNLCYLCKDLFLATYGEVLALLDD